MDKTKIDWADSSWNPVTGCFHPCEYCYARKMAYRFTKSGMTQDKYDEFVKIFDHDFKNDIHVLNAPMHNPDGKRDPYPYAFEPTLHRYRLNDYKDKKGRTIFVGSMTDLFGEWVPDEWIKEVFAACEAAPQHRYLFLTKNPKRYIRMPEVPINIKNNMWFGTSLTGGKESTMRSDELFALRLRTGCNTFLSIEPLLERMESWEIDYIVSTAQWVIIGAETGNRKEKVIPEWKWIADIYVRCKARNIPVFMKESLRGIMQESFVQEFPWDNNRCPGCDRDSCIDLHTRIPCSKYPKFERKK